MIPIFTVVVWMKYDRKKFVRLMGSRLRAWDEKKEVTYRAGLPNSIVRSFRNSTLHIPAMASPPLLSCRLLESALRITCTCVVCKVRQELFFPCGYVN